MLRGRHTCIWGVTLISLRNYIEAEKELLRTLALGGEDLSLPHYYLGGLYWGNGITDTPPMNWRNI